MKKLLAAICFFLIGHLASAHSLTASGTVLANGSQPQVSVDNSGTLRIVFGRDDEIFCMESHDQGTSFSVPVLIGKVAGMHLGMSRAPQLASSTHYSIVTAMDKSGNIHWFRLDHKSGKWENMGLVNDKPGSAPEGLMNIAADNNDHFYAVWLDIRTGGHNQIYFTHLAEAGTKWSKNSLVYQSPDGHVCECCQPHVAVSGNEVAIMFRNWLNGSRDLYLVTSHDQGHSFSTAEKLGLNTWKLNACPMDGGGLTVKNSSVQTTWQRQGQIFYCKPGEPELYIGNGRGSCIVTNGLDTYVGYQSHDTLKMVSLPAKTTRIISTGEFMKSVILPGNTTFCVWEDAGKIRYAKV